METYRFTHMLGRGRLVDLFYVPARQGANWNPGIDEGPHFTISTERADEIEAAAPQGLKQSTFRIVRNYGSVLDLEWIT